MSDDRGPCTPCAIVVVCRVPGRVSVTEAGRPTRRAKSTSVSLSRPKGSSPAVCDVPPFAFSEPLTPHRVHFSTAILHQLPVERSWFSPGPSERRQARPITLFLQANEIGAADPANSIVADERLTETDGRLKETASPPGRVKTIVSPPAPDRIRLPDSGGASGSVVGARVPRQVFLCLTGAKPLTKPFPRGRPTFSARPVHLTYSECDGRRRGQRPCGWTGPRPRRSAPSAFLPPRTGFASTSYSRTMPRAPRGS